MVWEAVDWIGKHPFIIRRPLSEPVRCQGGGGTAVVPIDSLYSHQNADIPSNYSQQLRQNPTVKYFICISCLQIQLTKCRQRGWQ